MDTLSMFTHHQAAGRMDTRLVLGANQITWTLLSTYDISGKDIKECYGIFKRYRYRLYDIIKSQNVLNYVYTYIYM